MGKSFEPNKLRGWCAAGEWPKMPHLRQNRNENPKDTTEGL